MQWLLDLIKSEWATVMKAPMLMIIALAMGTGIGWLVASKWYETDLQTMRDTVANLQIKAHSESSVPSVVQASGQKPLQNNHQSDVPGALLEWASPDESCDVVIDGHRLKEWRDKYNVFETCLFADPTIDPMQNDALSISHPFAISDQPISISVPYSQRMLAAFEPQGWRAIQNAPKGAHVMVPRTLLIAVIVLPKGLNGSELRSMSDVEHLGGIILRKVGLFGQVPSWKLTPRQTRRRLPSGVERYEHH